MSDTTVTPAPVTAALCIIGNEILSGRTKDKNIGFLAEELTGIGIQMAEVRVVRDDEAEIIAAVRAVVMSSWVGPMPPEVKT